MSLTITPSPFGSLLVSVAETGSTLSVTTVATSPSVLSMALGVPGPTGEQGPAGANGVGVPTGGSAGQVLSKIDGTNYNTQWTTPTSGGGTWGSITGTLSNQTDLYDALNGKLSLTGGTLSAPIVFSTNGTSDSEVGAWGFGVEDINGHTATVEPNQIGITTAGVGTFITSAGITGPASGDDIAFSLSNASIYWKNINVSGAEFTVYNGGIIGKDGNEDSYGLGPNGVTGLSWSFGANGATFPDTTVQTTAALPLTGGTLTGNLSVYNVDSTIIVTDNVDVTTITQYGVMANEVRFNSDNTIQTTAFPGYSGTTSQYIDGTGAYQTFPTAATKMVTTVRNNSGATITKGTVVYINGAVGNKPTIAKAQANSEATSKATFAFVETDIANNTEGDVVQLGLLENIDTQGFSDGTQIFLSPTTAGGWTSTQPFSPYHYVRLGTIIRGGHPTQGSISINIINGFQLDELSDVGATAPTNNNVLTWNSSTSQWLDKSIATILGYTPANGTNYLAKADNLSGLASTSTARTNLGLGTMATATATDYLAKADNLSGLASTSTARTNLGLGTASTLASTAVAQTANNLSDLASASTARTNLGLGTAATQSTATFLQTANNLSDVTASTARTNLGLTSLATSSFATTAESEAMTSTTAVLSPARLRDGYFTANITKPNTSTWLTATSGTGGINDSGTWDLRRLEGPTSAANTYVRCDHGTNVGRGRNHNANIDWSKYNAFQFRITQYGGADANSIFRATLGEVSGTNTGDPTVRSVGIRFNGTGAIKILAHNGTTLTTYTTSYSLTSSSNTDILVISDGSGTVEVFANGTSIGSTTGGPTTLLAGTASQSAISYRVENNNTPSGTQVKVILSGTTIFTS